MRRLNHQFWALALICVLACVLAGCAVHKPALETVALADVTRFSTGKPGEVLPGSWQPWTLSRLKKPTAYRMVQDDGKTVISARADASASGLIHPLANLDPRAYAELSWRWKVEDLIKGADNTRGSREDSPVRLVVTFAGDMDKLDFGEKIFYSQVKAMTGQQMPYATLMYIWENRAKKDMVIANRHTGRIKMVVAESGRDKVGRWQEVRRNLVEDYKRAFGEEPGAITAIGIMTDTDNTGERVHAWYGDISLHKHAD
ncbi:MAG TPA: DUF3047 domain-containing protein [Burkholderiales bacterium]|nr:DUF3047 domain-containing protein [Burkholderiales bacterium]